MRYNPIPYDHLVIPQSATFEANWYADDAETGNPAQWEGWSATMRILTAFDGETIATIATTGTRDGDLTLTAEGNITATLPASFTGALASGAAVFDVNFTDPDGAIWRAVEGSVYITEGSH